MKMAESKHKYIAEGFFIDVTNLVQEFVALKTVEFKEFASVWRKHHFSLIFMGRPDPTENSEFVNEIFKITCQLLLTPSFYQQIGAVYTLYSLFKTQISEPVIKIRLEREQWDIIQFLRSQAKLMKYLTLHYVIDYLRKHAFLYVANQALKGPLIRITPNTTDNDDEEHYKLVQTYKSGILEYKATNHLEHIEHLRKQYAESLEKQHAVLSEKFGLFMDKFNEDDRSFEKRIAKLNELMDFDKEKNDSLGARRAKLRAKSFIQKSEDHFKIASVDKEKVVTDDVDYHIPKKKSAHSKKQRRAPKEERKVGRPRKKPLKKLPEPKSDDESDDAIDISHLFREIDFFYPLNDKNRKIRTKRAPYYEESDEHDSDDVGLDNIIV